MGGRAVTVAVVTFASAGRQGKWAQGSVAGMGHGDIPSSGNTLTGSFSLLWEARSAERGVNGAGMIVPLEGDGLRCGGTGL